VARKQQRRGGEQGRGERGEERKRERLVLVVL
jgi:hypothetical protein